MEKDIVKKKLEEEESTMKPVLVIKKSPSKPDFMEPSPQSSSKISNEAATSWASVKQKLKTE